MREPKGWDLERSRLFPVPARLRLLAQSPVLTENAQALGTGLVEWSWREGVLGLVCRMCSVTPMVPGLLYNPILLNLNLVHGRCPTLLRVL